MIKRIKSIEELDNSFKNDEAILINDNSEVFDNVKNGVKRIEGLSKKYPSLEIRIVKDLDGEENEFRKLIAIKDELLKSSLASDEKIKIQLPGMVTFKNFFSSFDESEFEISTTFHNMKEVSNTEKILNTIVNDIKSYNFSPFESILASYLISTQFKDYKEANDISQYSKSRSIYAIMFNDYIVCEGYSRLFNNILARLGFNSSEVTFRKGKGAHAISLTTVEDSKYNVYGKYIFDPTLDNYVKRKNNLIDGNTPVTYFGLTSEEFEIKYPSITVDDLYFVNSGEETHPSLDEEDYIFDEVSEESINHESLRNCYINVYSKIFNTNIKDDTEFNEKLDNLLNNRNSTISK